MLFSLGGVPALTHHRSMRRIFGSPYVATLALATSILAAQALAQPVPERLNQPDLPETPYDYSVQLPAHLEGLWRIDSGQPAEATSNEIARLGRVLFYDSGLSRNGLVSCASCHSQALGFDDSTRFPIGFAGLITARGSIPLANARFNPRGRFFRDERAENLKAQVLQPFTDEIEMGLMPGELVERVEVRVWYGDLFARAFGDDAVSEERIAMALAQFVGAIVSTGSRYDRARANSSSPLQPFDGFNEMENRGKFLFFATRQDGGAGCAQCHETEAFVMLEPRNNGTNSGTPDDDAGLGELSGDPADSGLFRAPSLKNAAVTAPYMHDGRFATLEQVIDHYSHGLKPHPNLDPLLSDKTGRPAPLDLVQSDRLALIAFLKTLTDEKLLRDPRFADPFARRRD